MAIRKVKALKITAPWLLFLGSREELVSFSRVKQGEKEETHYDSMVLTVKLSWGSQLIVLIVRSSINPSMFYHAFASTYSNLQFYHKIFKGINNLKKKKQFII